MHGQSYVFVLLDMNKPMLYLQHAHDGNSSFISSVCCQTELKTTTKTSCPTTSTFEVLDVDQAGFFSEFGNFIAQTCLPKALAWLDHSIRILSLPKNTPTKGMDVLIDAVVIIHSVNEYWAYSDWPMTSQTKQSIKMLASSKWLRLE